jgi:hypothetical protein
VTRGAMIAVLALAGSVAAAAPTGRVPSRPLRTPPGPPAPVRGPAEFEYRGVRFAIPVGWSVKRGEQQPFRPELVTVRGTGLGTRLTFGPSAQPVAGAMPRGGATAVSRSHGGLAVERYEMPNPAWQGVLYILPEAGISVAAQVQSETEARAADAVVQSAQRALPKAAPKRS